MGNCEMICDSSEIENTHQIIVTTKHKKHKNQQTQPHNISSTSSSINLSRNPPIKLTPTNDTALSSSKANNNLSSITKIQSAYKKHYLLINQPQLVSIKDEQKTYLGLSLRLHKHLKHIFGILKWSDGDLYKGEFYNDYLNGLGRYYTEATKATYEGSFKHNEMNGFGIETWKNGSVYTGDYVYKEKKGLGCLSFEDGSVYEGEFNGNNINGYGTMMMCSKGQKLMGCFRHNQLEGFGIWEDEIEQRRFEGEMNEEGVWNGYGVLYEDLRGVVYVGQWLEGRLEGDVAMIYCKEGNRVERMEYRNDKEVGRVENEKRKGKGRYDGVVQGIINEWAAKGK